METVLKVTNLSIHTRDGDRCIIKDVSFEVHAGEVVAISGENGAGKSSILKAIMRHGMGDKRVDGCISYCSGENILTMKDSELQRFRAEVAYVPQRDEYDSIGKSVTVLDVISDSARLYLGKPFSDDDVKALFDRYKLRVYDPDTGKPQFYENARPAKLSGGQQRMLSIISAVAVREDAKLFIIDEPLNNLDFRNARKVSDLITRIHKNNPNAAILMVTHCRIFPAVTRMITVRDGTVSETEETYVCHSCFGKPNAEGYYEQSE